MHIPRTIIHRYLGDDFTLRFPFPGLAPASLTDAELVVGPLHWVLDDMEIGPDGDGGSLVDVAIPEELSSDLDPGLYDGQLRVAVDGQPAVVSLVTIRFSARLATPDI